MNVARCNQMLSSHMDESFRADSIKAIWWILRFVPGDLSLTQMVEWPPFGFVWGLSFMGNTNPKVIRSPSLYWDTCNGGQHSILHHGLTGHESPPKCCPPKGSLLEIHAHGNHEESIVVPLEPGNREEAHDVFVAFGMCFWLLNCFAGWLVCWLVVWLFCCLVVWFFVVWFCSCYLGPPQVPFLTPFWGRAPLLK